ncbi:MAG TPA: hypothetical protein VK905_03570, partial [Bacillota bacterium]|nr:hypothetical protein [Bacillota bacterium]
MNHLLRLTRYARPYARLVALAFVCMLSVLVLGLLPPLILRTILDRAIPEQSLNLLAWLVA